MRRVVFALTLIAAAPAFAADNPADPLIGVWRGELGGQAVMACFGERGGTYYYLRHPAGLALVAGDARRTWTEQDGDKPTGEWRILSVDAKRLGGEWRGVKGAKPQPIALERVSDEECSGGAFDTPRVESEKLSAGKPAQFQGKAYRSITALRGQISGLELGAGTPGADKLNPRLREQARNDVRNYYECMSYTMSSQQFGEYSSGDEIKFWNSRWLAIENTVEETCGGAHPNHYLGYAVWDVQGGEREDTDTWFIRDGKRLTPGLGRLIAAHARGFEPECREALQTNSDYFDYSPRPDARGMIFLPQFPHALTGCRADILVPYARLAPYLTPAGKAAVRAAQGR